MKLTEIQEQNILAEFNAFRDKMYAGKNKKERKALGQFFTPADLTIQILKQLDCTYEEFIKSDIIDPTSGSGNLLAAALIIGADPHRVFGNEYDYTMVVLCRDRLKAINSNVQDWQIHQGNALQKKCITDFSEEYITGGTSGCHYQAKYIDDLKYAQSDKSWRWENEQAAKRNAKPIDLWSL